MSEGIGDTIRYSLTADPVEEAKAGRQLLEVLGLRERKGLDLIACPSCGRAEVDVIKVAQEAQDALDARNIPLQVAVMGCVVNGPGEARDADLGIAAGRGKGHLFVRGQVVRVVPEAEMVAALVAEAELIVAEGIEARLAAADENAEAIAAATRDELLQIQGVDANHSREAPRASTRSRSSGPKDRTPMPRVRSVLIVGGGSSGWMAASGLQHARPELDITLVESSDVPTVGVGEATLNSFHSFLLSVGLHEDEFLHTVGGALKLGIRYRGWSARDYWHPFGEVMFPRPFLDRWMADRATDDSGALRRAVRQLRRPRHLGSRRFVPRAEATR